MSLNTNQRDILAFFNLEDEDVQDVSFRNDNNISIVDLSLRPDYPNCPFCGNPEVKIKGYDYKIISHGVLTNRKCQIHYKARRYICPVCRKSFHEHNPFCFNSMKISALTVQNVLIDLKKQTETFSSVAYRYHISPTSAASIFDRHVQMSRLSLPELMSWDESYAFHHQCEDSKYVFMILDFTSQDPVDILPSRRYEYLKSYFLKIPEEERHKVKMISTDMYIHYRRLIKELFPHCYHSVDHYHVIQDLSRKVDKVRLNTLKKYPKYKPGSRTKSDENYLLTKFNWLIYKRNDTRLKDKQLLFDPNRERKMNRKLNRMLNFYDIKGLIEDLSPDIKTAWRLKDEVVDFYANNTYETANEAIDDLIKQFFKSGIPEMVSFGKTLRNWKEEIVNSFIIVNHTYKVEKDTGQVVVSDQKLHNGIMENRNSLLKTIKKNSNGYTNWSRFRNRCLYVLRHDATFQLNPIIPKKTLPEER